MTANRKKLKEKHEHDQKCFCTSVESTEELKPGFRNGPRLVSARFPFHQKSFTKLDIIFV